MPIFNEIVIIDGRRAIVSGFEEQNYIRVEYEDTQKVKWVLAKKVKKTGEFINTPIPEYEIGDV